MLITSKWLICERQRALYGIKCVLRIFWQTWLHILMNKKKSAHCKHVPCNTLTHSTNEDLLNIKRKGDPNSRTLSCTSDTTETQALVSFKKYMPPPLPYFKVNICPFLLPHFASIFFAYLWSFRWPNYIVTLARYFSFRLPHLNIPTGPPSDELDKNSQWTWLSKNFSHWNGYNHFRFVLDFSYAFGIL